MHRGIIPRYGTGMRGWTNDGTGLLGTGIFGAGPWDWTEWTILGITAYAFIAMFLTTKRGVTKGRVVGASKLGQRRRKKVSKLREKAKRLEAGRGRLEGLLLGS
jgi:hypothetical protein